jgi:hypothetical protein
VIGACGAELVRSGGTAGAEQAGKILVYFHCTPETAQAPVLMRFPRARRYRRREFPVNIEVISTRFAGNLKRLQRKRLHVADTTKIEDKLERKKLKRTARKKAAPKAKRTGARGERKKKVKKLARGVSKR